MAKKSEKARPYLGTKKHLARQEREQRLKRIIIAGTIFVLVSTFLLITVPLLITFFIHPRQPVGIVNGEEISTGDWQTITKYNRYNSIRRIESSLQLIQLFGNDPNTIGSINMQIQSQVAQLNDPTIIGKATLDQMIDDTLIRQEANKLGITVSQDEIEEEFQAAFGYFPNGTPTPTSTYEPIPTSTLSDIQKTLIPPSATPEEVTPTEQTEPNETPTAVSTPTTPSTPTASPTPFTLEGYEKFSQETLDAIADIYNISKEELIEGLEYSISSTLYRDKLKEAKFGDISCTETQAWARHILVEDEETAQEVYDKLQNGDDFCALASEYSTDPGNKDSCGDLGWFGEGVMVKEFEETAFQLDVGEISEPVETQFGFHIIQSLGKEERNLDPVACNQKKDEAFDNWFLEIKALSDIEIMDYWQDRVPDEPTIPFQTQLAIQQLQQLQQQVPPIPLTAQP